MSEVFRFGRFELDLQESSLRRDGVPVPLTPKAFSTLAVLVGNAGRLIDKETLLQSVWPDTFVEEVTLAQNISALRKALGESESDRYIETVPKRGYRFVAAVQQTAARTANAAPVRSERSVRNAFLLLATVLIVAVFAAIAARSIRKSGAHNFKSLAVLPFKDLSPEQGDAYIGLAMADALITKLGNVRGVVVRPTSAVRHFAKGNHDPLKAGRELQVDAVLDGNIQRSGEQIRLSVQLYDVRSQAPIWSDTFDLRFTDTFSVQDRLSEQVAAVAVIKLNGGDKRPARRHTNDAEAYEAHVKGRYFWNKRTEEGYRRAIEHFNVALTRDPNFALAMSGLADAYSLLGSMRTDFISRHEAMSRARALSVRALEIDPNIAEAHTSLAFVKMHYDWDWKGAETEFRRALALNPGYPTAYHWYAYFLLSQGRTDEAVTAIRRAEKLDPLSLIISTDVAEVLFYARRYPESCRQIARTLEMDPHFPLAHRVAAACHGSAEETSKVIEHLQKSVELGRDDSGDHLVSAYEASGREREARELYEKVKASNQDRANAAIQLAGAAFALGRFDEGFELVEKAYAERSGSFLLLKVDPSFDPVRSDPRYHDLLRRIGLPPEDAPSSAAHPPFAAAQSR